MMTARDRLEFAIRFAEMNLVALRPSDWMVLRDDLEEFLGSAPGSTNRLADVAWITVSPHPRPQELGEDDLRRLRGDLRSLLRGVAAAHQPVRLTSPISVQAHYSVQPAGQGRAMLV